MLEQRERAGSFPRFVLLFVLSCNSFFFIKKNNIYSPPYLTNEPITDILQVTVSIDHPVAIY